MNLSPFFATSSCVSDITVMTLHLYDIWLWLFKYEICVFAWVKRMRWEMSALSLSSRVLTFLSLPQGTSVCFSILQRQVFSVCVYVRDWVCLCFFPPSTSEELFRKAALGRKQTSWRSSIGWTLWYVSHRPHQNKSTHTQNHKTTTVYKHISFSTHKLTGSPHTN